ncbi:RagB/SusD family nutrient uptake outer membrane protein [Echinicola marina]|uniref:RagB/SusD family nutrient uptake outer membrane protein n=1 Tax=Echinicola marina TaxID=2859768 RepID=UPI001CF68988|nr:RagB/SusD family nutrient uptake outer membrane protein [Echinicola marina]UCS92029.1 RagB/SusD family nutrient uptake outer membrane protein [Echinicola marina]
MKKTLYIFALILMVTVSCNESDWLAEETFDFYSANNSYNTEDQFNAAVARLYEKVEPFYTFWPPYLGNAFFYTSDIAYDAISVTHQLNSYEDKLIPEATMVSTYWQRFYSNIYDANVIINRIEGENTQFSSEASRNALKAEAMFFRAYNYRFLNILFKGVPLVTEEIRAPKRDFVRASEQEIWDLVVSDLLFAEENLPNVTELEEDGRLTKAAVRHLLAEVYISKGEYDKAIEKATAVIDDPNYALMKTRFGTRQNEEGDVYWDLFRRGNQNRKSSGNTESIWVKQYEYLVEGGGQDYRLTWVYVPNYPLLKDEDGKSLFIGPTSQNGGDGGGGCN